MFSLPYLLCSFELRWCLWNSSDINMLYCSFCFCTPWTFPVAHGWQLPSAILLRSREEHLRRNIPNPRRPNPSGRDRREHPNSASLVATSHNLLANVAYRPPSLVFINVTLFKAASIGRSCPLSPDVFHSFTLFHMERFTNSALKSNVDVPVFFLPAFFDVTEVIEIPCTFRNSEY